MNGNEERFFPVKQRCDYFAKKHQFFDFDLASIWYACTAPFVMSTDENFSSRGLSLTQIHFNIFIAIYLGIRLVTIILSEIMMETWQKSIYIIPDD